jgi:hypothetical protein
MSVETPRGTGDRTGRSGAYGGYPEERGGGFVTFAGVMLVVIGTLNCIGGIAAIDDANFYVANAQYVFSDLNTWGWIILITGAVQVLAGLGVFVRNQLARWLGVGFACLNMLAQFLFFPAQPLWSLMIIGIDTLIVYGLVVYGDRDAAV